MITVYRRSPLTGRINSMDLPITEAQLDEFYGPDRPLIQDMFPDLTANEREFILTGIPASEWLELAGEE